MAAVITPTVASRDKLVKEYAGMAVGASPGKKAGVRKAIEATELELVLTGVDFTPWTRPQAAGKGSQARTPEQFQAQANRAYRGLTLAQDKGPEFQAIAAAADDLLTRTIAQAKSKGHTLLDPRKDKAQAALALKAS